MVFYLLNINEVSIDLLSTAEIRELLSTILHFVRFYFEEHFSIPRKKFRQIINNIRKICRALNCFSTHTVTNVSFTVKTTNITYNWAAIAHLKSQDIEIVTAILLTTIKVMPEILRKRLKNRWEYDFDKICQPRRSLKYLLNKQLKLVNEQCEIGVRFESNELMDQRNPLQLTTFY